MIENSVWEILETVASEERNLETTREIVFCNNEKLQAASKKLYDRRHGEASKTIKMTYVSHDP